MKTTLFLISILFSVTGFAAIFKQVMPDGTVIFSDRPQPGAEEIHVKPSSTFKSPPIPKKQPPKEKQKEAADDYTSVSFITPTNDMTIRDNRGRLGIAMSVDPSFRPQYGHKISLKLDGKTIGNPSNSLQFDLENIERGSHTLQASVSDKNGNSLIDSETIIFHMKRFSQLFNKNN